MYTNGKLTLSMIAVATLLPIITVITNANILFSFVLFVWIMLMLYALMDLDNNAMLFAFLIAFFIFLMGRDLLENYFHYRVEAFTSKINNHAYLSMLIALIFFGASYIFFKAFAATSDQKIEARPYMRDEHVLFVSKVAFYVTICIAILSKLMVVRFVFKYGYISYYTDYYQYLASHKIFYIINKLELMMPVALSVYMACLPSKKELRLPLCCYLFYLVISLGGGQRSACMLGVFFLLVYYIFRQGTNPEEQWFRKEYLVIGLLCLPILAILFTWYNAVRFGETDSFNWYHGFFNFFYEQGVTSNAVKRAFMNQSKIPNDKLYILEFMRSGIIARLMGIKVYHGNTIEHALYGGSFTHTLNYIVLGDAYLKGRGIGTSYLAELYQDFGYIGIALGNILYGFIVAHIVNFFHKRGKSTFLLGIELLIITNILWAPRGSCSEFLTELTCPTTPAILIAIFIGVEIMKMRDVNMTKGEIWKKRM